MTQVHLSLWLKLESVKLTELTLARTGGGWVQPPPPLRFFAGSEKNGGATRRRVLGYLMEQTLRNFWLKKLTRSGQVTEL